MPETVKSAVALFNEGEFFECHEVLEDQWGLGTPAERAAAMGILKAAVALHHHERGNRAGLIGHMTDAVRYLQEGKGAWLPELDLAPLLEECEGILSCAHFYKDDAELRRKVELPRIPEPWLHETE
ncbi:MAG TPA: DUF309 domain-containing protein [Candidatus Thermoplasmatota archaeon]|nr:DUF309 domain-containing protein [Candidatus Thermoplasmatota archaeon]